MHYLWQYLLIYGLCTRSPNPFLRKNNMNYRVSATSKGAIISGSFSIWLISPEKVQNHWPEDYPWNKKMPRRVIWDIFGDLNQRKKLSEFKQPLALHQCPYILSFYDALFLFSWTFFNFGKKNHRQTDPSFNSNIQTYVLKKKQCALMGKENGKRN